MGKKMVVGNTCHIKIANVVCLVLFFCICLFLKGTSQNDNIDLYDNSKKIHRYLMTHYIVDDTNSCLFIDYEKRSKRIKLCQISKSDIGKFLNAEYQIDLLYGISYEGKCFCFLFGNRSSLFCKTEDKMQLPDFFNEQLRYIDHYTINIKDYTIPLAWPRLFVDYVKYKSKLILLFKKELSINPDYFLWEEN